jgi:formiminoglutamase
LNAFAPSLPVVTDVPSVTLRAAVADDPRVGDLAGRGLEAGAWPTVALIGFPCDEGVRRNGGRVGAAQAPDRIRHWFYRLTPGHGPHLYALLGRLYDFGNLRVEADLEAAQARLGEAVAACLAHDTLPIVIGGGHETAFGHFLGYATSERPVAILNWDAHPDVRPLLDSGGHSGSPFRQVLEHASGACRGYLAAGLLPHAAAAAHVDYITSRRGQVVWRDEITAERISEIYRAPFVERRRRDVERLAPGIARDSGNRDPGLVVSFDVDAVDQAFAPAVSAPAAGGLSIDLWLHAAREAGASSRVSSIDIVEVNPSLDRDDQTSRLAALTIWTFLNGLASRAALLEGS